MSKSVEVSSPPLSLTVSHVFCILDYLLVVPPVLYGILLEVGGSNGMD